jgi:hypothetical protein
MKKILTVTLLLVTPLLALLLWHTRERSENAALDEMLAARKRESYEIVSHSDDALIHALFTGEIHIGSPIQSVTLKYPTQWTESYGPYTVCEFDESRYSWRTLVAYDGRIVRASVGSCTWDWTFFDNLPSADATTISRVQHLRKYIASHPENAEKIRSLIQEQLLALK